MNVTKRNSNVTIYINTSDTQYMKLSNILALYEMATDVEKSKEWYQEAQEFAQRLSNETGIAIEKIAKVIAAVSPQQRWEINMRMAERAVKAWVKFQNGEIDTLPAAHRFPEISNKAYAILNGEEITLGQKTGPFAKNILGDTKSVTVDSLAVSIPLGFYECAGTYKFQESVCNFTAELYKQAAAIVGVEPANIQAITWEVCRRMKKRNGGDLLKAFETVGSSPVDILTYIQHSEKDN